MEIMEIMTNNIYYIETIEVQTDPLTLIAHIYVCHGNLLKLATSLQKEHINKTI